MVLAATRTVKRIFGKTVGRRSPLYYFQIPIPDEPKRYFLGNMPRGAFNESFLDLAEDAYVDLVRIDRYGVERLSRVKTIASESVRFHRPIRYYFCTEKEYKSRMRKPKELRTPLMRYISVTKL